MEIHYLPYLTIKAVIDSCAKVVETISRSLIRQINGNFQFYHPPKKILNNTISAFKNKVNK